MFLRFPYSFTFVWIAVSLLFVWIGTQTPIGIIFLMFGIQSSLLMNFIPITFALETLFRKAPKVLIVFPIAYYGIYTAYRIQETQAIQTPVASIELYDGTVPQVRLGNRKIVVDGLNPHTLVTRFDIPEVYYRDLYDNGRWKVTSLVSEKICPEKTGPDLMHGSLSVVRDSRSSGSSWGCIRISNSSEPESKLLIKLEDDDKNSRSREYTLSMDGQTVATVKAIPAPIPPLTVIPFYVSYCAFNSHPPTWKCASGFTRERAPPTLYTGGQFNSRFDRIATAAQILGLRERPEAKEELDRIKSYMD